MEPYEEYRFENTVDENYICTICMNVLKDPVMCQRNEHYFCNECITKHLENFQTCPTCMDKLITETLRQPPRIVTNYLFNLKIRCDYYERGCREIIRLGDLKTHVEDCGFSPVVCSNDGCLKEINKRDRTHHESEVCDFRRVRCHDCTEVRKELAEIKVQLEVIKGAIGAGVKRKRDDDLKQSVHHQLEVMKEDIIKSVKQAVHHNDASSSHRPEAREDIIVAGGYAENDNGLHSVEMFNWKNKAWTPLPDTKSCSGGSSLVVHNNQIISIGGGYTTGMENSSLLGKQDCREWSDFSAKLPKESNRQKCMVNQDHLFVIGGKYEDEENMLVSNSIYSISLIPPHPTQLLTSMPQPRCYHGVEYFDNDMFIFGGSTDDDDEYSLDSVLKYNMINNEITEVAPLPFAMNGMATVTFGDNAVIMGGCDENGEVFDTVMMYSFKTGQSKMLPSMIHKREGTTAVITGNVIVVMGGCNEEEGHLSSVECFSFDRYSWKELPPMKAARSWATAVLKPRSFL